MSAQVDVLAVMDADARAVACVIDECRSLAREASWRSHLAEHDKARAAVAELIEALESALATAAFEQHPHRAWHDQARAALARVQGGAL